LPQIPAIEVREREIEGSQEYRGSKIQPEGRSGNSQEGNAQCFFTRRRTRKKKENHSKNERDKQIMWRNKLSRNKNINKGEKTDEARTLNFHR